MSARATRMTRALRTAIGGGLLLAAALAHAGTVHYYYTDPQGTVLAKADAQGAIVARYDYAPYGTSAPNLDAAPAGPGYTGHVNDPDTGLVYMQARYYDPVVGRFLSVDPVAPVAGDGFNFNRYAYADNSPIVHDDPTGAYTTPVSDDDRNRGAADTGIEGNNAQDDGGDSLNQSREVAPNAGGLGNTTGSTSNGTRRSATPPVKPKVEASGFPSDLDAAKAAGKAYGGSKNREVELGLVQISIGDWGYLTPGWGPAGATLVDPTPVLQAYKSAGLSVNEWMHGHFDGHLGFSAQDFGLVYGQSAPFRTFMVNSKGETRWMSYRDLLRHRSELSPDQAIRGLQGYQQLLRNGLPGH